MLINRFSRVLVAAVVALTTLFALSGLTAAQEYGSITKAIMQRGELICGVNAAVRGFGFQDSSGEFSGFDVDFCRAVAAAILGDANKVVFRPLTAGERQAAIQSGEIDMMSRNTTATLSRDAAWGAIFGPTLFYDGAGVMTRVALGVGSVAELDGSSMCVQSGTTTETNISDYIRRLGLNIELVVFPDAESTWDSYLNGRCESWTTDKSGLVSYRASAPDPEEHIILPDTVSKEPLGPLSPQSDENLAEIIRWVAYGLMEAEEYGITSQNVDDFLQGANESPEAYSARVDPRIQRLLGQNNTNIGVNFGIANDFMVAVIKQVGNYGEIYDRHLTPLGLVREGSFNDLYTRGGLIYGWPFR